MVVGKHWVVNINPDIPNPNIPGAIWVSRPHWLHAGEDARQGDAGNRTCRRSGCMRARTQNREAGSSSEPANWRWPSGSLSCTWTDNLTTLTSTGLCAFGASLSLRTTGIKELRFNLFIDQLTN
jgi:hypothetical protein